MSNDVENKGGSAVTRARAGRNGISYRLVLLLAVLGFEIMALLIGLILGFWFLAYIGAGVIILALIGALVMAGFSG